MCMIKFKNVTKVYNKTIKAVNNVSFEVRGGEIVGFTGPNGSGKTTTIKMLTGILPPDSGKIKINGFDIKKNMIQAKSSIGYIADSPDMFLRLKGIEFLNFIADVYKVSDDDRKKRVSELAERFELTDALSSPMMSYSHGMRQKLMVIAALVHNPPAWFLDVPLTGLDPKSSYELKEMMREHAKKGNAVFFSTHVLEVAEKLCDKVIIIKKGNLLYDGTLENLESQHLNQTLENIFLEMTEN